MSPPGLIHPLSDAAINQIAAGEVIERPASIVKELIENSLDAGARRIGIELDRGGIERIQIRDDGHGIEPDQLHLALSRHCTSKLVDAAELASIGSLGFRGEALASIAAVAEVSLISRTAAHAHGWRVDSRPGGEPARPRPDPHALGTTIEVRGLFATLPARRRFLKRPRTEFLYIQQLLRRAGFCYAEVAFTVIHDGRQTLSLPAPRHASSEQRRRRTLFGQEFTERAQRLDVSIDGLQIRGWVGEVGYSRQNSDLQTLAVNRRIVRDRHIAHAVRMAYGGTLVEGRYAAYALHLELPAAALDVNVHPGKAEVRFHDPRTVHDLVYVAVKRALGGADTPLASAPYAEASVALPVPGVADSPAPARPPASIRRPGPVALPHLPPAADSLLAITADRFALSDDEGVVRVMDLHAAIRAVVHARLVRGERGGRPLIVPEAINIALGDERLEALAPFGVEFGRLGEAKLALRTVPVVINEVDPGVFGAALATAVAAGAEEIDAIALAAARAFRAPRTIGERRRWFASLKHHLLELGCGAEDFSAALGPDRLSGLFESDHR